MKQYEKFRHAIKLCISIYADTKQNHKQKNNAIAGA